MWLQIFYFKPRRENLTGPLFCPDLSLSRSTDHRDRNLHSLSLRTGHKVKGSGPAETGGGSSIFKLMKRGGHLNIGLVYRVGQVETGHSSKTSLIQETEGENLPREWDFRSLCGVANYCVFREDTGQLFMWLQIFYFKPRRETLQGPCFV